MGSDLFYGAKAKINSQAPPGLLFMGELVLSRLGGAQMFPYGRRHLLQKVTWRVSCLSRPLQKDRGQTASASEEGYSLIVRLSKQTCPYGKRI